LFPEVLRFARSGFRLRAPTPAKRLKFESHSLRHPFKSNYLRKRMPI
jgi:hypothetical protein